MAESKPRRKPRVTTPPPADDPAAVLASLPDLIGDSDELRELLNDRLARVVELTFDQIEDTLLTGDPSSQQALMTKLLPQLIKVRDKGESSSGEVMRQKAEVVELFAEMGRGFAAGAGVGTDEDLEPEDGDD